MIPLETSSRFGDYLSVLKPSIALLNVFVGIAAILIAVGLEAPWESVLLVSVAGFLAAGGAGAINCYVDKELDQLMTRTKWRPLPAGRILPERILILGLLLSAAGVGIAALFLNLLTAFFVGMGVFWYVFVYTMWLKPKTKWNIVIGGAAGCFSALAGWAAVTGTVSLVGILVAALIFLWTPGHFWGLAIAKAQDYVKSEVPMLPATEGVEKGSRLTALSNASLFPFTLILYGLTANWANLPATLLIGAVLAGFNLRFLMANLRLAKTSDAKAAWFVFKQSAQYLFVILVLVVAGRLV